MRPPDYPGELCRAWRFGAAGEHNRTPAHYAHVYSSLIHAPHAHPFWSWHLLTVVSLRDIVGVRPAKKIYPEAEYEISVFAIDPKSEPDPDRPPYDLLQPYDVLEHFHGVTIDQARELGELCTRACVDGLLVPDEDFRPFWKNVVHQTVAHMRGEHG